MSRTLPTIKPLPSKEELFHLFSYDRECGVLIWKNPPWNKRFLIGRIAGSLGTDGYWDIRINCTNFRAHRLIFFIETGTQPEMIDHIDGVVVRNHYSNLRESTNRKNQQNRDTHRKGRLVGASWEKNKNAWRSRITLNKKRVLLGYFPTEFEAHWTYLKALSNVQY